MTISAAIERLEKVKARLANTRPFFIDRLSDWIQLAESTARTVLSGSVPEGVDHADWMMQVDFTIGLIGAQILGGEASGIILFLGRAQTGLEGFEDTLQNILASEVTLTDIQAYVQAGLDGVPGGKEDITEEDRARSPLETAFIIRKAIATGKSQRDEAIAKFVNERNAGGGQAMQEFYPAIRDAWAEVFSVVAFEEMRGYVAQMAKEF